MQGQTSQDGNKIKRIYIVSFTGGGRDRPIFVDKCRADKVGLLVNNLGTVICCAPDTKNIPKVADRHFISQEYLARSTSVRTSYYLLAFHPASYIHYILPPLNLSFMTASWVALPRRIRGNRFRVHCFWNSRDIAPCIDVHSLRQPVSMTLGVWGICRRESTRTTSSPDYTKYHCI